MEDCLPPSLVNKERPKRFFDPSSKWRSLAYPQHLQLGAVQLSVPRTKSTHNWTISNRSQVAAGKVESICNGTRHFILSHLLVARPVKCASY